MEKRRGEDAEKRKVSYSSAYERGEKSTLALIFQGGREGWDQEEK